jgi:hypothetical protein
VSWQQDDFYDLIFWKNKEYWKEDKGRYHMYRTASGDTTRGFEDYVI